MPRIPKSTILQRISEDLKKFGPYRHEAGMTRLQGNGKDQEMFNTWKDAWYKDQNEAAIAGGRYKQNASPKYSFGRIAKDENGNPIMNMEDLGKSYGATDINDDLMEFTRHYPKLVDDVNRDIWGEIKNFNNGNTKKPSETVMIPKEAFQDRNNPALMDAFDNALGDAMEAEDWEKRAKKITSFSKPARKVSNPMKKWVIKYEDHSPMDSGNFRRIFEDAVEARNENEAIRKWRKSYRDDYDRGYYRDFLNIRGND